MRRIVPLLLLLVASPAAAGEPEIRSTMTMALGGAGRIAGTDRFTAAEGDQSTTPLAFHFGLTGAIGDWAVELMGLGTPLDYDGRERSLLLFEPAFRHDVVHRGPLRLFLRGALLAGKVASESDPGPCSEDGCASTEIPGLGAYGFGVGAGIELGHCTRDHGYFALSAVANRDLVDLDGDAVQITTVTYGFQFGSCIH